MVVDIVVTKVAVVEASAGAMILTIVVLIAVLP